MQGARRYLEFVRLAVFEKQARGLLDEEDIRRLERALMENPTVGVVIAGTGGLRKYRFAVGDRGKRGGARVIYYHRNRKGRIYLITVYTKGTKESLTKAEQNEFKRLTAVLDGES